MNSSKLTPILSLFLLFSSSYLYAGLYQTLQDNTAVSSVRPHYVNIIDITGPQSVKKPKNIILMIGDGMGINHIQLAQQYVPYKLNITRSEQVALVKTNSADSDITDSAAAGTALATGNKTTNGSLGVDSTGKPLKSILKYAEEYGLATGLIATSEITHATPASFIACVSHRSQADKIAAQFLTTDIDVFIGGGYNQFAKRADSLNYIDSLKQKGYTVIKSLDELRSSDSQRIAGLLYPEAAPKALDGRGDMLSIATSKTIEILSKDNDGFFLMIEGSQIDWGGHDNNIDYIVSELTDFDKAVGIALDYAESDGETLVIVVADHETGGLTLTEGSSQTNKMEPHFSTTHHSAAYVPLFTSGVGSERFKGIMDNTEIFSTIFSLYGFSR